jgi:hypothetical protein
MWTGESRLVPDVLREAIQTRIRELRPTVRSLFPNEEWWAEGRRFHSDEQCFQAAVMYARLYRAGSDADHSILAVEKLNTIGIERLALEGLKGAASCDYYYLYEKSWD